jgi:hypothetical protein
VTARELASVAGKVVSVMRAFAPSLLFLRSTFALVSSVTDGSNGWNTLLPVEGEVKEDLIWLRDHLRSHNGRFAWRPAQTAVLQTDALGKNGWGATLILNGKRFQAQGFWSEKEKLEDIHILEMKAIFFNFPGGEWKKQHPGAYWRRRSWQKLTWTSSASRNRRNSSQWRCSEKKIEHLRKSKLHIDFGPLKTFCQSSFYISGGGSQIPALSYFTVIFASHKDAFCEGLKDFKAGQVDAAKPKLGDRCHQTSETGASSRFACSAASRSHFDLLSLN